MFHYFISDLQEKHGKCSLEMQGQGCTGESNIWSVADGMTEQQCSPVLLTAESLLLPWTEMGRWQRGWCGTNTPAGKFAPCQPSRHLVLPGKLQQLSFQEVTGAPPLHYCL